MSPDVIVMTSSVLHQLQAANSDGVYLPESVEVPDRVYGIPFEVYPTSELCSKRAEELIEDGKIVVVCTK